MTFGWAQNEELIQGTISLFSTNAHLFLLLLYNKTLNKHVTALFCLYLGNVDTSANHFRNAPVGGHTCITAGEQGEPAD